MQTMTKQKAFNSKGFSSNEGSLPRKIADFLVWAAKQEPRRFITLPEVVRAVYGVTRGGADQEDSIRRRFSGVNKILHEEHSCALVNQPGAGVRATTGDEDTARTALPKRMKRLDSARKAVVATASIIDSRKIADVALRKWVETGARKAVGLLAAPDFERQITMPAPGSPEALKLAVKTARTGGKP
jgi:hypothetical protein